MALRAYFDGSHEGGGWTTGRYLSLAGFAIDDSLQPQFNDEWNRILRDDRTRPVAPFIHMRELRRRQGCFATENGWDEEKRAGLIIDLLKYLQTLDKHRCRIFACSLDLGVFRDYRRSEANLPGAITICNFLCPQVALHWYLHEFPGLIVDAYFYFDRSEPFRHDFEKRWRAVTGNRLDAYGHREGWKIIKKIDSLNSDSNPPLQAADLLAWGTMRNLRAEEGDFMRYLSYLMQQIIPATWIHVDENTLPLLSINQFNYPFLAPLGNL